MTGAAMGAMRAQASPRSSPPTRLWRRAPRDRRGLVRFDGSTTYLIVDLTFLNKTPYTIAVIEVASNKGGTTSYFMGDTGSGGNGTDNALHTGYRSSGDFTFAHYGDDLDYVPGSFTYPAARVWMDTIDTNSNKTIYLNGMAVAAGTAAGFLNAAGSQGHVGSGFDTSSTCFQGDVAEILVYTNSLSAAASLSVLNYLSNKWLCASCAAPALLANAVSAPFTVRAPTPPPQQILGAIARRRRFGRPHLRHHCRIPVSGSVHD